MQPYISAPAESVVVNVPLHIKRVSFSFFSASPTGNEKRERDVRWASLQGQEGLTFDQGPRSMNPKLVLINIFQPATGNKQMALPAIFSGPNRGRGGDDFCAFVSLQDCQTHSDGTEQIKWAE